MASKIILSGRLFEKNYKENIPFRRFAEVASKIGYDGVELRTSQVSIDTEKSRIAEYSRILSDKGLIVGCMEARGYPILENTDVLKRFLDLVKAFNCPLIKTGGDPGKIRKCAEIASGYGIRAGTNNHVNTPAATIKKTLALLQEVNSSNFGVLYDPCHLFISGSGYGIESMRKLNDRIFCVLVQYIVETEKSEGAFEFDGRYYSQEAIDTPGGPDFNTVFSGLKKIGYNGYVSVITPALKGLEPEFIAGLFYKKIREKTEGL